MLRLRIGGNLPAPIVNGGEDRPWKVQFSELQKPRDLNLDLGSGHTHSYGIPLCISHRPLSTYQISLKSKKKLFGGRTYGRKL